MALLSNCFRPCVHLQAAYNTPTILQADQEAGRSVLQICACDRLGLAVMYLNNPLSGSNTGEESDKGSAAPELKELGKAGAASSASIVMPVTFEPCHCCGNRGGFQSS